MTRAQRGTRWARRAGSRTQFADAEGKKMKLEVGARRRCGGRFWQGVSSAERPVVVLIEAVRGPRSAVRRHARAKFVKRSL